MSAEPPGLISWEEEYFYIRYDFHTGSRDILLVTRVACDSDRLTFLRTILYTPEDIRWLRTFTNFSKFRMHFVPRQKVYGSISAFPQYSLGTELRPSSDSALWIQRVNSL